MFTKPQEKWFDALGLLIKLGLLFVAFAFIVTNPSVIKYSHNFTDSFVYIFLLGALGIFIERNRTEKEWYVGLLIFCLFGGLFLLAAPNVVTTFSAWQGNTPAALISYPFELGSYLLEFALAVILTYFAVYKKSK